MQKSRKFIFNKKVFARNMSVVVLITLIVILGSILKNHSNSSVSSIVFDPAVSLSKNQVKRIPLKRIKVLESSFKRLSEADHTDYHEISNVSFVSTSLNLASIGLPKAKIKNFEFNKGLKNFIVKSFDKTGYFSVKANSVRASIIDDQGIERKLIYNPLKEIYSFDVVEQLEDKHHHHSDHHHSDHHHSDIQFSEVNHSQESEQPKVKSMVTAQSTITLMAVYDSDAQTLWESEGSSVAQEIAIQEQVANEVLSNSNSGVRVDFIASMEYDFDTSGSASTFINEIIYFNPVSPEVAHIRATRNKIGADLIVFFYETQNYAGSAPLYSGRSDSDRYGAYLSISSNLGYSLVLAHELGHVLGCGHAKNQAVAPGPGYHDYSAGYFTDSYRTIMTYSQGEGRFLARYFSSPELKLDNEVLGDTENDNRRTILEIKDTVSNYRQTVSYDSVNLTALKTSDTSVTISWDNSAATGAEVGYQYELYELIGEEENLIYSGVINNYKHSVSLESLPQYKLYFKINGSKMTLFSGTDIVTAQDLDLDTNNVLVTHNKSTGYVERVFFDDNGTRVFKDNVQPNYIDPNLWTLVAQGDIDGDGIPDLVWQSSEHIGVWLLNSDYTMREARLSYTVGPVDSSIYQIKTVCDVNQDGRDDLIFQNTTGGIALWHLDSSGVLVEGKFIHTGVPFEAWRVVGSGDIDGDDIPDLIWQSMPGFGTGKVAFWKLTADGQLNSSKTDHADHIVPTTIDIPYDVYQIKAVSDFTGDGICDLVFQNTDGGVAFWPLNNLGYHEIGTGVVTQSNSVNPNLYQTWRLTGSKDINDDGVPDLTWERISDGTLGIWGMNSNGTRE